MSTLHFGPNAWYARIGDGFDESSITSIACALGDVWASSYKGSTVLVGYDIRRDSQRLAMLAAEVIASFGLTAIVSDRVCPTPALGWAVARDRSCVGGLMLTAGNMPREYGGIVVRGADGGHISTQFAAEVERRLRTARPDVVGEVRRSDLVSSYLNQLASEADGSLISSAGLRVVVDAMYGAGSSYLTHLLKTLGCEVIALHDKPVSDFRGLHPDTREPWVDECERAVVKHKADLGIVLDGDATHMALIDADGRLVSSHYLAPLALEHVVRQRGYGGRVVATMASSARTARQAERLGCDFTMVPVGAESIYREFFERDVILATDATGSIWAPRHLPERDAIMAALMLLELISGSGESVRGLVNACERNLGLMEYVGKDIRMDHGMVQRLRNLLPGINPPEVAGMEPTRISHADGLRAELPDGSWILLRCSRMQPVVRIVAEAKSHARARELLAWGTKLASS